MTDYTDERDESVLGADVDEPDCEEATQRVLDGDAEPAEVTDEPGLDPGLTEALDDALLQESDEAIEEALRALGHCLGAPGGGWGGSEAPVRVAMRIGRRNGLMITSTKRSTGSSGSDHHVSQRRSFAADMSNGSRPTPEMDRTCRQIAALCGNRPWSGCAVAHGYRMQMLYRTWVGGNHFNHVHVGVRMGARC